MDSSAAEVLAAAAPNVDNGEYPGSKKEESELFQCPGVSPDGKTCDAPGQNSRCIHSSYGANAGFVAGRLPKISSMSESELQDVIGPDVDGGLIFTIKVLPDGYDSKGEENLTFLEKRDYDPRAKMPKPRRKMPFPVTSGDFYSSVCCIGKNPVVVNSKEHHVEDYMEHDMWDRDARRETISSSRNKPPRWMFNGVINGWPGIPMPLEVIMVQCRDPGFLGRRKGWSTLWDRNVEGRIEGKDPSSCCKSASIEGRGLRQVKVKLRAPHWSAHGWSRSSPGFAFWVEGQQVESVSNCNNPPDLTVTYGTNLLSRFKCKDDDDDPRSTRVHMISHRYATGGSRTETPKEKLTYHSIVLIEWDHRRYCSVVEIAYLNGLGGYRCKSNWYADRDARDPSLYAAYPPEMVMPWKETMSEIRVHDVPYQDLDSFLVFMKEYEGHRRRFVDISVNFSHVVRLTYRSRRNIATYLLNYIRRDETYSEMKRNCQTFAADLCGFLAGKKDVQPFHPVNQIQYVCQKHKFLYESSGYQK